MDRPLDEIFTTVETTRKTKYFIEKYRRSPSVDLEGLSRVARNLFGSPPSGEMYDIEKELDAVSALDSSRWDFDFRKGRPLEVSNPKYVWRRPKEPSFKKQSSQGSQSSSKKEKPPHSNRITNYLCSKRKRAPDSCTTTTTKSTTKLVKYSAPQTTN